MDATTCSSCGLSEPEVRLAHNKNGEHRPTCCACLSARARRRHHPEGEYHCLLTDAGAVSARDLAAPREGEGRRAWVRRAATAMWSADYPVTRVHIDEMVEMTGLPLRVVRDEIEAARRARKASGDGTYVTIPRVELED